MITIKEVKKLISDRRDAELKHFAQSQENVDPGFNIFSLVSDIYYRENFHSDVMAAILDVNGKHGAGSTHLFNFIDLINMHKPGLIDSAHYKGTVRVSREAGRRDITIEGLDKHTIIIENKINDAGDTQNQIPTYVKNLEDRRYTVDAVVYLTLNQSKEPDRRSWIAAPAKQSEIIQKLVSVRAFDGSQYDLCSGWLQKCIESATHIDTLSTLRQYFKIIRYLTRNHMDHEYYSKLNEYFKITPGSVEAAIHLRDTLSAYPQFIKHRIFEHFKLNDRYRPFNYILPLGASSFYLDSYQSGGFYFNTDVKVIDLHSVTVDLSVRHEGNWAKEHPEAVLDEIKLLSKFEWDNNGRYVHTIKDNFTEFEKLTIEFVEDLLKRLKDKEEAIGERLKRLASQMV